MRRWRFDCAYSGPSRSRGLVPTFCYYFNLLMLLVCMLSINDCSGFHLSGMECSWSASTAVWVFQSSCSENDYGGTCFFFWPYGLFSLQLLIFFNKVTNNRFLFIHEWKGLFYMFYISNDWLYTWLHLVLRTCLNSSFLALYFMLAALCIQALRHLRQIAQETSGEVVYALGRQPAVLRTFSQRLSRWFLLNFNPNSHVHLVVQFKT
jgi:hypothetical protein